MARARNIKPGFFFNVELAELGPFARLLFIGLWTIADRDGRLEDQPKKIKALVLPYDQCDADQLLNDLQGAGFIQRYEVDNCKYIQIVNFTKHQNPHIKEQAGNIPAPDMPGASTVQEPDKTGSCPADSLNLIPDSLNPQEREPRTKKAEPKKTATKKGTRLSADWEPDENLIQWAKDKRPDLHLQTTIETFKNYWTAKTGKDATKLDWPATFRNWVIREKSNGNQKGSTPRRETAAERIHRAAEESRQRYHDSVQAETRAHDTPVECHVIDLPAQVVSGRRD